MKLWGGRFESEPEKDAKNFTNSIYFDYRLAKYDVAGSIAHVKMLGARGIIPKTDAAKAVKALKRILAEIEKGKFKPDFTCEDIHTDIEKRVIKIAGEAGKKMHTARSRNDQIALDERMYIKEEINNIAGLIEGLKDSLLFLGKKYAGLTLCGFTHMQHAQPVKFSVYLGAYMEMLNRDTERFKDCYKRVNVMPLGACALAGTSLPIDRKFVAKQLGFPAVTKNTIDSVSDRDFIIEFASCAAVLFVHLTRLAEEMVIWSTKEFKYIEIPDEFATGSSIMPQKKNPDIFELLRGKSGRVFGALTGILTIMKGLPLAYNSDMQEDKVHLFSVVDTVKQSLLIAAKVMKGLTVNETSIKKAGEKDYSDAVEIANYLVKKGLAFKDAHLVVGKIVLYCIKNDLDFKDLDLYELKKFSVKFDEGIYRILN
ncbi:MAG: argininosuccinate lyase [Candidatus Firestonebacteria bacterium]